MFLGFFVGVLFLVNVVILLLYHLLLLSQILLILIFCCMFRSGVVIFSLWCFHVFNFFPSF